MSAEEFWLMPILASYAQEESRSVSENCKWRIRKRFAQGELVSLRFMFGYRIEKGEVEVDPETADIVRMIFEDYIGGMGGSLIAKKLREMGVPALRGGTWNAERVVAIIKNEKYTGNALLQKTFCVDFLTKKMKVNEGEVPQYYVENSHPAIVTPETFDMVQYELSQRKSNRGYKASDSPFSGKVICGECGGTYGSKVWHSTSKYRRTIWQCNHKYRGKKCDTPHLYETALRTAFVEAFNRFVENKGEILQDYETVVLALTNTSSLEKRQAELKSEYDIVMELMRKCMEENARTVLDQNEYNQRYTTLMERYEAAQNGIAEINDKMLERTAKREKITRFLDNMKCHDKLLTEFDEKLWLATVESVTVHSENEMAVIFKDGSEVHVGVRGK